MTAAAAPPVRAPVLAGSGNRAVAFALDLTLLLIAMAGVQSILPRGLPATLGGWTLAFLYFALFPLTPLRGTPGKAALRIKLSTRKGERLDWRRSAVRAAAMLVWVGLAGQLAQPRPGVEWATTVGWIVFFLAWAPIGVTAYGQSLFDIAAGTVVVRSGATAEAVAQFEPLPRSAIEKSLPVVPCLLLGFFIDTATRVAHDRNLRGRVGYALEATVALQDKVTDFYKREGRWPTAAELGVAESTPYPDGGYYKLQKDGSLLIAFTEAPRLKGRTITLQPLPGAKGVDWRCKADPGLAAQYLPARCRPG